MRLVSYILVACLSLVAFNYGYYKGYNTGSNHERFFMNTVVVPLCAALNQKDVDNLVRCIIGSVPNEN